jgi:hypothetical protein
VSNSPINFNDPTGHKPCDEEYGCAGKLPNFSKVHTSPQPALTAKGRKMLTLFQYYANHPHGPWNANGGDFTPADFVAWILMSESNGDTKLLEHNKEVFSRQLWGTGYNGQGDLEHMPYCSSSSPCINGMFNFVGEYSQSGPGRYQALMNGNFAAVEAKPGNYWNYGDLGETIQNTGNDVVVHPKWTEYNNDVATQTGNYIPGPGGFGPPWVTNMCDDTQMNTTAQDGIVYKVKGENGVFVVVYTLNQANYWKHHKHQDCP